MNWREKRTRATGVSNSQFDVLRPDPAGTIESLASLGYTTEAAIADIVDNSITAGSTRIDLQFRWAGAAGSTVSIVDNGVGMNQGELLRGLTVGGRSTAVARSDTDLGRFGMGLKSASFSQAREVIVSSGRSRDEWLTRTWDVDHVLAVGDWQLLHGAPADAETQLGEARRVSPESGTAVIWRRLTRLAAKDSTSDSDWARDEFYAVVERVEQHLGMVFGRFLSRSLKPIEMALNGNAIVPWDPFLRSNSFVDVLALEKPLAGVKAQGFVLPHRSRLSDAEYELGGGPRGWLDQQGFYVYRDDRLIVAGDWLKLGFRKDDKHSLARICIDMPSSEDFDWTVDVRKSSAMPPAMIVPTMRRIARATRHAAVSVINHRGKVVSSKLDGTKDATWQLRTQHGVTTFRVNREHPLVKDLLERSPETRPAIRAVLNMIESSLPVGLIQNTPDADMASAVLEEGTPAPESVVQMAREVLAACISQGQPPDQAVDRVCAMPPFPDFPMLRTQLIGSGNL